MIYQILNGDSLANDFPQTGIAGEIIVIREALIDGDLSGNDLSAFWKNRALHHGSSEMEYRRLVIAEFEKIMHATDDSEFNLWFEYDLFCQVNMWFVISILNKIPQKKKVFAVYTTHLHKGQANFWNGFGPANADELAICFSKRIPLTDHDLKFGQELWEAYKRAELEQLGQLSKKQSPAFPFIREVIQAHVERYPKDGEKGRPEKLLEEIAGNISTDFEVVFREFWKTESIYGFGDVQLKRLFDKVMQNHRD